MRATLFVIAVTVTLGCGQSHGMSADAGERPDGGVVPVADAGPLPCDERSLRVDFVPTARAQLAVWIEGPDERFRTVALTEATAYRGIGNRPGAQQMNTGYHWPMGRREGVLPRWAHRRIELGGAPFPRVVFQDRREGFASGGPAESSSESYFCMAFSNDSLIEMDAVTCASPSSNDKGRFLTDDDVAAGYAEPFEDPPGTGRMRPLSATSAYPPRRDLHELTPNDHADAARFDAVALEAMPELDAVTMATPREGESFEVEVAVPADWPDGVYEVWVEANTELDFSSAFPERPTPTLPDGEWDSWAQMYGRPRGGQPSTVYRVEVEVGAPGEATAASPVGRTAIHGHDGRLLEATELTDDSDGRPGSGADRLLLRSARRVRVVSLCR